MFQSGPVFEMHWSKKETNCSPRGTDKRNIRQMIKKKLEALGAAVAFAEAGEFGTALDIMDDLERAYRDRKRKIVLVAKDDHVSPNLVEYAMGLASRLGMDTLFLSILSAARPSRRTLREHAESFNGVWRKFSGALSGETPGGVHRHAVLCGDLAPLVTDVCHRLGGVEMVIIQKQKHEACDFDLCVPVFCFDK